MQYKWMRIAVNSSYVFLSTQEILIKNVCQIMKRKSWYLLEGNDKHVYFPSFDYGNNGSFPKTGGTTLKNHFKKPSVTESGS